MSKFNQFISSTELKCIVFAESRSIFSWNRLMGSSIIAWSIYLNFWLKIKYVASLLENRCFLSFCLRLQNWQKWQKFTTKNKVFDSSLVVFFSFFYLNENFFVVMLGGREMPPYITHTCEIILPSNSYVCILKGKERQYVCVSEQIAPDIGVWDDSIVSPCLAGC